LWGLKLTQFWGPSLTERIQNYEYKIGYENEHSFRVRKEISTNYKFKTADKHHKHHKIQKNNIIFSIINCLKYLCNT